VFKAEEKIKQVNIIIEHNESFEISGHNASSLTETRVLLKFQTNLKV
jgi:hypothetical protein